MFRQKSMGQHADNVVHAVLGEIYQFTKIFANGLGVIYQHPLCVGVVFDGLAHQIPVV